MQGTEDPGLVRFFESLMGEPHCQAVVRSTCQAILGYRLPAYVPDAVQESWCKVWQSLTAGTSDDITKPNAWLKVIARNTSLDILRRNRRFVAVDEAQNFTTITYHDVIDSKLDLERAYKRLMVFLLKDDRGLRQRRILTCLVQEMSVSEIAARLNIATSLVSKDIHNLQVLIQRVEQIYQRLMARLSDRQQEVLHLAEEGKTGQEIAASLKVSPSLVTQELQYMRQLLKQLLAAPWDDGNGGGQKPILAQRWLASHPQKHDKGRPGDAPFVASLLRLPAFDQWPLAEGEMLTAVDESDDSGLRQLLAQCLLDLPALRMDIGPRAPGHEGKASYKGFHVESGDASKRENSIPNAHMEAEMMRWRGPVLHIGARFGAVPTALRAPVQAGGAVPFLFRLVHAAIRAVQAIRLNALVADAATLQSQRASTESRELPLSLIEAVNRGATPDERGASEAPSHHGLRRRAPEGEPKQAGTGQVLKPSGSPARQPRAEPGAFVSSLLGLPAFQELDEQDGQELREQGDDHPTGLDTSQLLQCLLELPAFGELGPHEDATLHEADLLNLAHQGGGPWRGREE